MLERDIEKYLVAKIKQLGGKAYKITSPGNNGFPDRLCIIPRKGMFLAEIKRRGEKPRKLQKRQIEFIRSLGTEVLVIDSIEDIRELYNVLKQVIETDYDGGDNDRTTNV